MCTDAGYPLDQSCFEDQGAECPAPPTDPPPPSPGNTTTSIKTPHSPNNSGIIIYYYRRPWFEWKGKLFKELQTAPVNCTSDSDQRQIIYRLRI